MQTTKITIPCRKAFKNNKILKLPMSLTGTCSQSLSVLLIIFTCQTCGKCSFFAWTQSDKLNICQTFAELNQLYPIWYLKFLSLRHHRFGIVNKTISADITNDTGKRTHKRCTAPLFSYQKVIIIGTWVKPQAITQINNPKFNFRQAFTLLVKGRRLKNTSPIKCNKGRALETKCSAQGGRALETKCSAQAGRALGTKCSAVLCSVF